MAVVVLTGATGFVGSELEPRLEAAGHRVRCAARDPERAARARPTLDWVEFDLNRKDTVERALRGAHAAVYLVHGMAAGAGYEQRERDWARTFTDAAASAGLERIVYLGGVAPRGHPSRHLQSRLATGEILRAGSVPVFELRAGMIIGRGSASFQIVRDLAARLPAMLLPSWLETRSQPIAIDDVVYGLTRALELPLTSAGIYDVPGPEILTAREILFRIAALRGTRPFAVGVPVLSPRLSSYWLKFVTGADYHLARELVEGLSSDLLPSHRVLWDELPEHHLMPFDEAARRALSDVGAPDTRPARVFERAAQLLSRRAKASPAGR